MAATAIRRILARRSRDVGVKHVWVALSQLPTHALPLHRLRHHLRHRRHQPIHIRRSVVGLD